MWDILWKTQEFEDAFNEYNNRINNSLVLLKEKPYDAIGRDEDLQDLNVYMERPETPVVVLLGLAGVGKSAIVEEYIKQVNSGKLKNETGHKYMVLSLRVGLLGAIGQGSLQTELANIFDEIAKLEKLAQKILDDEKFKFILFIDEFHLLVTIFGRGSKIGGDIAKDKLARPPIRVITATTDEEYNRYVATDKPFKERFQEMTIVELPKKIVLDILRNYYRQKAPELEIPSDELLELIYDVGKDYLTENAEPRKSKNMVETLIAYRRATGKNPTLAILQYYYRKQKGIVLDVKINSGRVHQVVQRRIKGQEMAVYTAKRMINSLAYPLNKTRNKPMMVALFTGPTGVGKTELTKALAEGVFGSEKSMFTLNMPEFSQETSEALFRKRLGEHIRRHPHSLILFDELEKAHQVILDNLLFILDEGLVSFETTSVDGYRETSTVSLRNSIIVATTNAGHEIFNNDAKFGNDKLDMKVRARVLLEGLSTNLITGETKFRPEFLGRFQRIIPFRALDQKTLVEIGEVKLNKMLKSFLDEYNIHLDVLPPREFVFGDEGKKFFTNEINYYVSACRVNEVDAKQGGARNLDREFNNVVYDEIVDKLVEYPSCKTFTLRMSKDSKVYKQGVDVDKGGLEVEPVFS